MEDGTSRTSSVCTCKWNVNACVHVSVTCCNRGVVKRRGMEDGTSRPSSVCTCKWNVNACVHVCVCGWRAHEHFHLNGKEQAIQVSQVGICMCEHVLIFLSLYVASRVGQNHTYISLIHAIIVLDPCMYINKKCVYIHGMYTALLAGDYQQIYSVYIRFWPTSVMRTPMQEECCPMAQTAINLPGDVKAKEQDDAHHLIVEAGQFSSRHHHGSQEGQQRRDFDAHHLIVEAGQFSSRHHHGSQEGQQRSNFGAHHLSLEIKTREGQNRSYTLYMGVCMVISLLIIPHVHRIYAYMYNSGHP